MLRSRGGACGGELVDFVWVSEYLFDVDALDSREAIFDEEAVGLPILRTGAALRRCEVFESVQVEGRVEGSCMCQGKENEEDTQHCDLSLRKSRTRIVNVAAMHLNGKRQKILSPSFPAVKTPHLPRAHATRPCDLRVVQSHASIARIASKDNIAIGPNSNNCSETELKEYQFK